MAFFSSSGAELRGSNHSFKSFKPSPCPPPRTRGQDTGGGLNGLNSLQNKAVTAPIAELANVRLRQVQGEGRLFWRATRKPSMPGKARRRFH